MIVAAAPSIHSQTVKQVDTVYVTDTVVLRDTVVIPAVADTTVQTDTAFLVGELRQNTLWNQYFVPVLPLLTLILLILTLLVSLVDTERKSRPTVSLSVAQDGLNVWPVFTNTSMTDARAIVKMRVLVDEIEVPTLSSYYTFGELWTVAANQYYKGNPGTEATISSWAKGQNKSVSSLKAAIEFYAYYTRDNTAVWPKVRMAIQNLISGRVIYAVPTQRWEYKSSDAAWIPQFNFRPGYRVPTCAREFLASGIKRPAKAETP
jgi:hypothetical protein